MISNDDGSAVEHTAPAVATTLPPVPASARARPDPGEAPSQRAARPRGRPAVWLAVAVGMAAGLALGIVVGTTIATRIDTRDARSPIVVSGTSGLAAGSNGSDRGEQVISAVLAAAPRCTPDIRIAGAPAAERVEFLEQARELATEASSVDGLRNVQWRVIERDGRLFGVLYGERCDGPQ
jgi:hypothetical protein